VQELAPVHIYCYLDAGVVTRVKGARLKQLVDVGALNPTHGWSHRFVEEFGKLESLAGFCAFTGQDPDALVAFCFLRKRVTGKRFASVARRAELADVLSFLIHNGVMMNPGQSA
jgi:hypothetical protein